MSEDQKLQPQACPSVQLRAKISWQAPELVVLPVSNTSNNSSGGGDGDSALATDS